MDGIININKPAGMTSFGVVAAVKRLSGEKRVGHAGTLDPAATGVLPVCLGQGTRVTEFLMDSTKAYRAEIQLGSSTDTYDASGKTTMEGDASGIDLTRLESALSSFRGVIQQVPPAYSAVKHRGRPLYKLARAGVTVERKSRPVTIHSLEITGWQPPVVTVEIVCGKGTYIRSIADDLGQVLGCGAHLKSLVRLRCGLFDIRDAVSLQELERAFSCGYWHHFVYPIDSVLLHWAAMVVDDNARQDILNGKPLEMKGDNRENTQPEPSVTAAPAGTRCRVYALDGRFLGVLRFNAEKEHWQPDKVFR